MADAPVSATAPERAPAPALSAKLSGMYQDQILDHYRRPRNRGTADPVDGHGERRNALCGDHIIVTVALDGEHVREARFDGKGCSIAQASASMLTDAVRGRTRAEIASLRGQLRALVQGDERTAESLRAAAVNDAAIQPLLALASVAPFAARHGCAMMAWDAAADALGVAN